MINKIKQLAIALMASAAIITPVLLPAAAYADCTDGTISGQLAKGANGAATGTSSADCSAAGIDDNGLTGIANKIVNIFSLVVGVVAVVMIIVGGFRYITSGGDSNKVGGAKNTLIYAIIGLIIVALAQIIVKFVLNKTTGAVDGTL